MFRLDILELMDAQPLVECWIGVMVGACLIWGEFRDQKKGAERGEEMSGGNRLINSIYIVFHVHSRELTYPTSGKGKSSSKVLFLGGYVTYQEGIQYVYI